MASTAGKEDPMGFRVPTPDMRKAADGLPLLALPENTVLKEKYTVQFLTVGGMSIAYRGTHDGREYFIKEVESIDSLRMSALSKERLMLERLDHPGIIKLMDFFEEDGFHYLVTEFIEGRSLEKLISTTSGKFIRESVILDWASQLCEIFDYLHHLEPQVIYRDLKPQNLILDREGRLHLVDFGIARTFKVSKTEDTELMGSALTASPEHFGGAQTDERSDIYTLGATLHCLATNGLGSSSRLFEFEPVRAVNVKISEHLEKVLAKCTELEPVNRYQSIAELQAALFAPPEEKDTKPEAKTQEAQQIQLKPPAPASPDNHVKPSYEPVASFFNMYKPYAALAVLALIIVLTGMVLIKSNSPMNTSTERALYSLPIVPSDHASPARPLITATVAQVEISPIPTQSPVITHSLFPSVGDASSPEPSLQLEKPSLAPTISSASAPALPGSGIPTQRPGTSRTRVPDARNSDNTVIPNPAISPQKSGEMTTAEYLGRVLNKVPEDLKRVDYLNSRDLSPREIDSDYKIRIPGDYLAVTTKTPVFLGSERVFATISPSQGEKSLRIVTILKKPNKYVENASNVAWNDVEKEVLFTFNLYDLNKISNPDLNKKYIKDKNGLEYTFTIKKLYSEILVFPMKCEQIYFTTQNPNVIYVVTALADPNYFHLYEKEFREFFENVHR